MSGHQHPPHPNAHGPALQLLSTQLSTTCHGWTTKNSGSKHPVLKYMSTLLGYDHLGCIRNEPQIVHVHACRPSSMLQIVQAENAAHKHSRQEKFLSARLLAPNPWYTPCQGTIIMCKKRSELPSYRPKLSRLPAICSCMLHSREK